MALEEGGLRFHQPHRADRGVEHDVGETIEAIRVIAQSHASSKGARAARARRLYVHANTLAYRLRTIRRLLGGDPARDDLRLTVELALKLSDLPACPASVARWLAGRSRTMPRSRRGARRPASRGYA